jgi:hypothetical protein
LYPFPFLGLYPFTPAFACAIRTVAFSRWPARYRCTGLCLVVSLEGSYIIVYDANCLKVMIARPGSVTLVFSRRTSRQGLVSDTELEGIIDDSTTRDISERSVDTTERLAHNSFQCPSFHCSVSLWRAENGQMKSHPVAMAAVKCKN